MKRKLLAWALTLSLSLMLSLLPVPVFAVEEGERLCDAAFLNAQGEGGKLHGGR